MTGAWLDDLAGLRKSSALETMVSVAAYGALGDGTDQTTAIDTAFSESRQLYFPPGSYTYNGAGFTGDFPSIIGAGRSQTGITLGTGKSLINRSGVLSSLEMRDMTITGGYGAVRHTWAGSNVGTFYQVHDCDLLNYTSCAISSFASDMPYWSIRGNLFKAFNDTTTMGVALHGSSELSNIVHNAFNRNRVHIKMFSPGCAIIHHNDLIQVNAATSNPRVGIWMIPVAGGGQADELSWIIQNKFGNESLSAGDFKGLFADEDAASGADFATRFPDLVNPSTGSITQQRWEDNHTSGNSAATTTSFCFSMTKKVNGCTFSGTIGGTPPKYILEFAAGAIPTPSVELNNSYGPWRSGNAGINLKAVRTSNDPSGYLIDPEGLMTYDRVVSNSGGGNRAGYKKLLATRVVSFSYTGGATRTSILDSIGGTDAVEMVLGSATQVSGSITPATFNLGIPVWIEFEAKLGLTSPCPELQFQMRYTSNGTPHCRRIVEPLATWRLYRFLWTPIEASTNINFEFQIPQGGTGGSVDIGRCRCYHAYEPQPFEYVYATADRPATMAVILGDGFQAYDTTLNKPIWSDGTVWRDATGSAI